MNMAVFCSGNGTNLQAIINAVAAGQIKATIKVVVSDVEDCYALERAKKAGIETIYFNPRDYSSREEFDRQIIRELKDRRIELVILAGYMRLLSAYFVQEFRNKILNIHPALLPSFKGTDGIGDALRYGVKITGVTVHLVDEGLDSGPIVLQEAVKIEENDTHDSLAEKIHHVEHKLYPEAIRLFVEGKLKIEGRIVRRVR